MFSRMRRKKNQCKPTINDIFFPSSFYAKSCEENNVKFVGWCFEACADCARKFFFCFIISQSLENRMVLWHIHSFAVVKTKVQPQSDFRSLEQASSLMPIKYDPFVSCDSEAVYMYFHISPIESEWI